MMQQVEVARSKITFIANYFLSVLQSQTQFLDYVKNNFQKVLIVVNLCNSEVVAEKRNIKLKYFKEVLSE